MEPRTVVAFFLILPLTMASSIRPPMDPREVMRLITTADPQTCRCGDTEECEIRIPNTQMLGIVCPRTSGRRKSEFCCKSRSFIKPFVTPADLAQIHAAVKRLKIGHKVQEIMNAPLTTTTTMAPPSTEVSLQTLLTDDKTKTKVVVIKPALDVVTTEMVPRTTTSFPEASNVGENTIVEGVAVNDDCSCLPTKECPVEQMDFSFGKSCKFGSVRCCASEGQAELKTPLVEAHPKQGHNNDQTTIPPQQISKQQSLANRNLEVVSDEVQANEGQRQGSPQTPEEHLRHQQYIAYVERQGAGHHNQHKLDHQRRLQQQLFLQRQREEQQGWWLFSLQNVFANIGNTLGNFFG